MNRYNSRFISLNLDQITLQCLKKPYTFLERDSSLEMKSEFIFITIPVYIPFSKFMILQFPRRINLLMYLLHSAV